MVDSQMSKRPPDVDLFLLTNNIMYLAIVTSCKEFPCKESLLHDISREVRAHESQTFMHEVEMYF